MFQSIPREGTLLTPAEARRGFTPYFNRLERLRWWKVGMDPATMPGPLREPASVVAGCVAVARAGLDGATQGLTVARETAEFLLWAQRQAGSGGFPFPAARGTADTRAMQAAARFLSRAEAEGTLDRVVRNGWVWDLLGDGGLQFDNGECGVALFDLHELTHDPRHLASARQAADWALAQRLCPNWNYNSFSVSLLARAYAATRDARYLDGAVRKACIGVIPGQLTDGPHAGRWVDPHNARAVYHYIMLRALARLAAALPREHAARGGVIDALRLGLRARNAEVIERGVMNKDKALEALLLVNRLFKDDSAFLRDTLSDEALRAMGLLVSEESRHGKLPVGLSEWGLFLESRAGQEAFHPKPADLTPALGLGEAGATGGR